MLAKHGALGCAPHGLDEKFHVLFATQNPGKMEWCPSQPEEGRGGVVQAPFCDPLCGCPVSP